MNLPKYADVGTSRRHSNLCRRTYFHAQFIASNVLAILAGVSADCYAARVFVSTSDASPVAALFQEPAISVRAGQAFQLYIWVMPEAGTTTYESVNALALGVRSEGAGELRAQSHEVFAPEFADTRRWNAVRPGELNMNGLLLVDMNAVALDAFGITGQEAASSLDPLFDETTGSYLTSRLDVDAENVGETALFLRVGAARPLPVDVPGIGIVDDKGDMNGDGSTNNLDLGPWITALLEPDLFAMLYPGVDPIAQGDILGSGGLRENIGAFGAFMGEAGGLITTIASDNGQVISSPASLFFGSLQDTGIVSGGVAGAESQRPDATIRIYYGGDMNGDGGVNNLDINPFALALTDPAQYSTAFPLIDAGVIGDVNEDGALNNLDIAPFAALLTGQAGTAGQAGSGALLAAALAGSGTQSAVPEPGTLALAAIALAALAVRAAQSR